jgi:hypothetical protein
VKRDSSLADRVKTFHGNRSAVPHSKSQYFNSPEQSPGIRILRHLVLGIVQSLAHHNPNVQSIIGDQIVLMRGYETMKNDWNNPAFALHWDQTALEGNPTRSEQLDLLLHLLMQRLGPNATMLDLAIGSGKVEEKLLHLRPDVRVVDVDASESMLNLAKQRLNERCLLIRHNLNEIESLSLPRITASNSHQRPNASSSATSQTERGVPLRPPPA